MARSASERMASSRARRRGDLPPAPVCSVCGKALKKSGVGRSLQAGLCHDHWRVSEEGKAFLLEQKRIRREKTNSPVAWRYFGAIPGGEAYPEGPFNRLRLAVSSNYAGRGEPRGACWIVWSDGVVTEHRGLRQVDVGGITRRHGEEVNRSDLVALARSMKPLVERVRHYGHGDIYIV